MKERCRIAEACSITGLPIRTMQHLSARGKVPGAAKLGSAWTYDQVRLRCWVREREEAVECQATSTAGEGRGGRASRFKAATTDEAYERALGLRRSSA